jgi:hypothetical protein
MLIYKLLGDQAQQEFARCWGVSYGMNVASEWKDVVTEAMKGAIILAILERLYITRSASWFEDHIGAPFRQLQIHTAEGCTPSDRPVFWSCQQTTIAYRVNCSATPL